MDIHPKHVAGRQRKWFGLVNVLVASSLAAACTPAWHGQDGPTVVSTWLLRCLATDGALPPKGFRAVETLKDFPVSAAHPIYRADTPEGVIYAFRDRADPETCGFVVFGGNPDDYGRVVSQALAASKWRYKYHFGKGTDDGWGDHDVFGSSSPVTAGDVVLLKRTRERRPFSREPDFIAWGPMPRVVGQSLP